MNGSSNQSVDPRLHGSEERRRQFAAKFLDRADAVFGIGIGRDKSEKLVSLIDLQLGAKDQRASRPARISRPEGEHAAPMGDLYRSLLSRPDEF